MDLVPVGGCEICRTGRVSSRGLVLGPRAANLVSAAWTWRRGLTITAEYVRTFFDVYLNDAPAALLNKPSQLYPEVQFVLQ